MEDKWMWCPRCGVRQWFKWVLDNTWKCAHCEEELDWTMHTRRKI